MARLLFIRRDCKRFPPLNPRRRYRIQPTASQEVTIKPKKYLKSARDEQTANVRENRLDYLIKRRTCNVLEYSDINRIG
ncbi:hypothetical protein PUN28_014379 [Cardiocondyla obscurior]|uniref:Ribosomal protein S18 n=1 Tax=Cardiocondyla obscurior TaxID=286306 RepID=A0AAW2F206_9HYME